MNYNILWIWWSCMLCNSLFNIYIWQKNRNKLAFLYIFTNAYRSTFPVSHFTNTCMFSICSPFVERSLSNIAELAFTIQVLNWFELSKRKKMLGFITINIAEIFCWSGLISGYSYLHAIENSIWLYNAIIILLWLHSSDNTMKLYIKLSSKVVLYCYISFMIVYDIPTYIYRPISTKKKILICEIISTDINFWKKSLIWMTGYFTFGSWVSLILSYKERPLI
jgi:hypothetical protein